MSTSSSPTKPDGHTFICECDGWMLDACAGEGFYKEHDGKQYCVLHYPGKEKKVDFAEALQRKLDNDDFNFRGVRFPDYINFWSRTFSANADFAGAWFSERAFFSKVQFRADANFNGVQFHEGADFTDAQFSADALFNFARFSSEGIFNRARFGADVSFFRAHFVSTASFYKSQFVAGVSFDHTMFSVFASFREAIFNSTVYFQRTIFTEKGGSHGEWARSSNKANGTSDVVETKPNPIMVYFDGATFKEGVSFSENDSADRVSISFAAAIFEKPERAVFHSTPLRPHWFINVDSRKFTFINVDWRFLDKRNAIRRERVALERWGKTM